jgi:regulator of protease activity HflC (stomatin/prohibitin superfamily)
MMRALVQAAVLLAVLLPAAGCTMHSTGETEVGVLTRKVTLFGALGKPGIQTETYAPGATYTFPALITDWNVYNVALQNLEMVADPRRGDRTGKDDVEFKTSDGNDIAVDVTVAWRIDGAKTPYVLAHVSGSTEGVKDALVRPACRSLVRDVLNTMTSEEFYVSGKRFLKAEEARTRLAAVLGKEGVIVERVILGEHHFHPEYEKVIREKKLAEQTAERMVSEGKAAEQESNRNLETARGEVSQKVAKAKGQLNQVKLQADADFFRGQREAEALFAEKSAHAKGVEKQNQALAGAGGRAMVKLKIAESLAGKQIVFLPGGGKGSGLQTLNLNDLLTRYAAANAAGAVGGSSPGSAGGGSSAGSASGAQGSGAAGGQAEGRETRAPKANGK